MNDRELLWNCMDARAKAKDVAAEQQMERRALRHPVTPEDWDQAEDEARERQAQAAMADHDTMMAWAAMPDTALEEALAIKAELARR